MAKNRRTHMTMIEHFLGMDHFFVAGIPQPKGSARAFVPKGWKRAVVTSANPKVKTWESAIRAEAIHHDPVYRSKPVAVAVILQFVLPRPKKCGPRPTVRPDLDKMVRAVLDALTGVTWDDDSQVTRIVTTKAYGTKPGVQISIGED